MKGGMLDYEVIPARREGSGRLLIALHGLGDSMEGYRWLPNALRLDDLNVALVNAPDPYLDGYSWYDIYGDSEPGVLRSREQLLELLAHLETQGYAAGDTVLFGFSQGCLMTLDVGLRYAKRFAGLVGVSGYVFQPKRLIEELSPAAPEQRVLFTHGTRDPLIPIDPVRQQVAMLREAGVAILWQEFEKEHTIAGDEEFGVIRKFVVEGFERS